MYTLFYEDTQELIGMYGTKDQAVMLAASLSHDKRRRVMVVYNALDGCTALCCAFQGGKQTFEGGCCPPPKYVATP